MNAWKEKVLGQLPSDLILVEAENAMDKEIWKWERVLGWERKFSIEREVRKWKPDRASAIYRKTQLDGLRSYWDLSSTKSRQRWICRGSIDSKSTSIDWEAVENLSAKQKVSRWIEKLSIQIPESSMDRNCANFCREKKKEGLDRCKFVEDLSRSYRA